MRAPARLLPILLAGLLVACTEPVATLPDTPADAGADGIDSGVAIDDAGPAPDAGHEPDAGEDEVDAGDPDGGDAFDDAGPASDAGEEPLDAGPAPDAGFVCASDLDCPGGTCEHGECIPCEGLVCGGRCVDEQIDRTNCGACGETCDTKEVCFEGACTCPTLGCGDVPECMPEALAAGGCGACLSACTIVREREQLEIVADAFRSFRKDTGGWPYFETDWSVEDEADQMTGGVDPTRFIASDVALFSQGTYVSCRGMEEPNRCWYGPYLTPGTNLVSEPWLDAWGRARLFALIPPDGVDGAIPSAPEGAVVIWSSGPDGLDQTGCTNVPLNHDPPCFRDFKKIAAGQSSVTPSDDLIVFVGSSL